MSYVVFSRRGSVLHVFGLLFVAGACGRDAAERPGCVSEGEGPVLAAEVVVVGEDGGPVAGATIELDDRVVTTDAAGAVTLEGLRGPALAVASAPGALPEPFTVGALGSEAGPVRVRLLSDGGGRRVVMHSAGDVMFGRRYEEPPEGEPLVPPADASAGAARVVAAVRRAFVASDVRTLNLETVVSDRDASAAYPGKRFILRSRPGATAGLRELSPTVLGLANNHSRDYGDEGIADTRAALAAAGLDAIGASVDGAPEQRSVEVRGTRFGFAAWTTVDGSFVNDNYPRDGEAPPPSLADKERYQYEARPWGFDGERWRVPAEPRRLGSAWALYRDAEGAGLPAGDQVGGWRSLATVYPELQDWVARRGHGGALPWSDDESAAAVGALRASSDVVVVNLHAGFQFQDAPGRRVRDIARRAIDAGADVVVCHHPHVVQGFEWYKGKLIAYSLGNFIFDQDFLSTFASTILRTVWEGGALVEARAIPVEIDAYRPRVAADAAARRTLARLWERSVLRAESDRLGDGSVRAFDAPPPGPEAREAHLSFEHGTARIVDAPPEPRTVAVRVAAGSTARLEFEGLVDPRLGAAPGAPVRVGRDLFEWGGFEDELADGEGRLGAHWDAGSCDKGPVAGDAYAGRGFLRLRRAAGALQPTIVRPVARVPLQRHRLWREGPPGAAPVPLDPDARYSVRLAARLTGEGRPSVRVSLYAFDDTDPTEDPTSEGLGNLDLDVPVAPGAGWQVVDLPLDPARLSSTTRANMVLLYVRFAPGEGGGAFDVDDLSFVEWRPAPAMTDRLGAWQFVANDGPDDVALNVTGLPLAP